MANDVAAENLQEILEQQSIKLSRPALTVLFRRGEPAAGMFVVLSSKVSLDLDFDSRLGRPAVDSDSAQLQRDHYCERRRRTRFLES
jgi:hypothetical protein